ncbi:MAG: hypothetical protein GSR84_03050 [Desulfurococcales archaeon]|nr:hypothetical protein [Desulfurococcales archaeon]
MTVQALAGTVLFIAAAWGVFLLLVAAIRLALGQDPRAPLLWGVALLVFASGGYGIIYWLYGGGQALGVQSSFVVSPADYYASRGEAFHASRYFPVEVTVVPILPVHDWYGVEIDWGDGSTSSWPPPGYTTTGPGEPASLSHVYHDEGLYQVTITIYTYSSLSGTPNTPVATETRSFLVNVTAPWYAYAGVVKSFLAGLDEEGGIVEKGVKKAAKAIGPVVADAFAGVMDLMAQALARLGLNAGYAFYYYVAMPTVSNYPAVEKYYGLASMWALLLISAASLARLVWTAFWEWERGGQALLEVFRDMIAVLVGIYVLLDLYNLLAETFNTISLSMAQLGQLGALYAMVVSLGAVMGALGLVAPTAGTVAAVLVVMLIFMVLVGILKWVVAAVIVASSPLLLVAWLVPGFRGVVQAVLQLLAALFIFSIIASVMSGLISQMALTLTTTTEGTSVVAAIAIPLIFAAATPWIANMITSQMGLGGLMGGIRSLARAPPTPTISTVAAAAGGGALLMAGKRPMSGQVVGYAPSPVYQPRQPTVATQPPVPPPQPGPAAGKPTIQEVEPPRGLGRITEPVKDVLAEARGEVETVEPGLRRRAAVGAAKAGLALGERLKRTAQEFDQTLSRELGVTPVRATVRTGKYGVYYPAKYTIKAARWAAPRVRHYAGRTWEWMSSRVNLGRAHASGRALYE